MMMRNRGNKGVTQNRLVKKRFFNSAGRMAVAKNSSCVTSSSSPEIPRHIPSVMGDMPIPPRRIGVAKKRGRRARSGASTKARQRALTMEGDRGSVKTALRRNGLVHVA